MQDYYNPYQLYKNKCKYTRILKIEFVGNCNKKEETWYSESQYNINYSFCNKILGQKLNKFEPMES